MDELWPFFVVEGLHHLLFRKKHRMCCSEERMKTRSGTPIHLFRDAPPVATATIHIAIFEKYKCPHEC